MSGVETPRGADTICAPGSAPGASPRALVRISGPAAFERAGALFAPLPRQARRRVEGQLALPGWPPAPAQAWTWLAPRSYTGEDVVELVLPGSPPLLRALLQALQAGGARLARPGELTRRAFLAGKLDLTRVEAVLALTTSEDTREARAALRALEGGLAARVDAVKEGLLQALAHLEAAIDFSEEELDLRADAALQEDLERASQALAALRGGAGPRHGTAPRVVLGGPANAGKSTLLNRLCGREAALVSPRAGTTRDPVAASWRLPGGAEVELLDTAGRLPEVGGTLDRAARRAADEAAAGADLVLWVLDGSAPGPEARAGWEACPEPRLLVLAKLDLAPGGRWPEPWAGAPAAQQVSARSGAGLAALGAAVAAALLRPEAGGAGSDLCATLRQEELLRAAVAALRRAGQALGGGDPARAELAALDLREALDALGALTGEVGTEDVLDRLFASFCVGK